MRVADIKRRMTAARKFASNAKPPSAKPKKHKREPAEVSDSSDTEEEDFRVDAKRPRFARDLPHARAFLSPGAARKFASNAAPPRPKPPRPAPPPPARKPDANSGDAGGIRDTAASAWDQAGGDGSMTSSHGPPGASVTVRGSPQGPTYSHLQGLGIEASRGGAGVDAGVDGLTYSAPAFAVPSWFKWRR